MAGFFRKLFAGFSITSPQSPKKNLAGAFITPASPNVINMESALPETMQLVHAVGQSVGRVREHNEDTLLAFTSIISGGLHANSFGLYIVADGMGGHQFGEVASNAAVHIMAERISARLNAEFFKLAGQDDFDQSLQDLMKASILEAHEYVKQQAPGSGTTVTAALVVGQLVIIAHVGDSRAYTIDSNGGMVCVTTDHSLVKQLEEMGQLTREEAENFPHRNVLIRALGQGDTLEADIFTIPFPRNGYLLLCSDGLWGSLSDVQILGTVADSQNLHLACHELVQAANTAGGPDNISVIIVQSIG